MNARSIQKQAEKSASKTKNDSLQKSKARKKAGQPAERVDSDRMPAEAPHLLFLESSPEAPVQRGANNGSETVKITGSLLA